MKKYFYYIILIVIALSATYLPLILFSHEKVRVLISEDGFYENLTVISYFLGGCVLKIVFFRSGTGNHRYFLNTNRNFFFLLLGLFLIFCSGEEISWGQRIFGVRTPEYMMEVNDQGETNLHNLTWLSSNDWAGHPKHGWLRWFTSARIYAIFWFVYCFLMPILDRFSRKARLFFEKISMPIVPLWLGSLFVMNHLMSKGFEQLVTFNDVQCIVEIKEATFSMLFLITGIALYFKYIRPAILPTGKPENHLLTSFRPAL